MSKDKPKDVEHKKIMPANVITVSVSDDNVYAEFKKRCKERGMQSKIVTEALRQYLKTEQPEQPTVEQTIAGMTKEEILERVWQFLGEEIERKNRELEAKIKKAREEEDWSLATSYREIYQKYFWNGCGSQLEEHPYRQEITITEVQEVFGLSYQTVYNKILPILRKAGYKVVKERKY